MGHDDHYLWMNRLLKSKKEWKDFTWMQKIFGKHYAGLLMLLIFIAAILLCLSCSKPEPDNYCGMRVYISPKGYSGFQIDCDSVTMHSETEIDVWINGKKNKIFSKRIAVEYIKCD